MSIKRQHLLASTLLTAAALLSAAPQAALAQDEGTEVEELVVTGSRIARVQLDSPVPVTVIEERVIQATGAINTGDILRTLPAAGVSGFTAQNTNFATAQNGVVTVDLRNLGEDRTLVLVNGRRYVAGVPGTQVVDFSTIPTDLISRIDVVTGGASAVYGSDALAGVINIITKKNFEGVSVTGQYGISRRGDDERSRFNVTAGKNFADDAGNAVISLGYNKINPIFARDRVERGMAIDAVNGFDPELGDRSIASQIVGGFSTFSEYGLIEVPLATGGPNEFIVYDNGVINPYSGARYGFNRQARRILQVPSEQLTFAGQFNLEISPKVRLFSEVNFVRTETETEIEAFPLGSDSIYGDFDLAFCDDIDKDGDVECTFGVPILSAVVPDAVRNYVRGRNPGLDDDELVIGFRRRLTDVDLRGTIGERQTFRTVFGLEGDITDNHGFEFSVNYGRTDDDQQNRGDVDVRRFGFALDATVVNGELVCTDLAARADGCVPINIFGLNTITPEAARYVRIPTSRDAAIEQFVVNGFLRGRLFDLPAGPLNYVIGAEYREEKSRDTPDALTQTGQSSGNITPETKGRFDVSEAFAELSVPLLKDLPWVRSLDLNLAGRVSDYSTVGETEAYAASLDYSPNDWIKFRSQFARAVRAPNITELFQPAQQDFPSINDPCSGLTLSGGNPAFFNVRENTANPSAVLASGVNTSTINDPTAVSCLADPLVAARVARDGGFALTQAEEQGVMGFESGNPDLQAETADTFTVGVLFNPRWGSWWDGLSVSVDYYDIKIKDRIIQLDQSIQVVNCYSNSQGFSATNPFCSQIERYAIGPQLGAVKSVDNVSQNFAETRARGLEVQASYRMLLNSLPFLRDRSGLGELTTTVNWSHVFELETVPFPGAAETDIIRNTGTVGAPRNEGQVRFLYLNGPLQVFWDTSYIGKGVIDTNPAGDYYNVEIDDELFHNMQVRWNITDKLAAYVGVDNVLDNYVFIGGTNGLVTGTSVVQTTGWTTFPDVYDGIGRRYYIGFNARF